MKLYRLLFLLLFFCLSACAKKVDHSHFADITIGFAPIVQAQYTKELLAGHLPENRIFASTEEVAQIQELIDNKAKKLAREILFLEPLELDKITQNSSSRRGILENWLAYGKAAQVDILFVPYLNHYNNSEDSSNTLLFDFFLIDIRNSGSLINRYLFAEQVVEEKQKVELQSYLARTKKTSINEMLEDAINKVFDEFNLNF